MYNSQDNYGYNQNQYSNQQNLQNDSSLSFQTFSYQDSSQQQQYQQQQYQQQQYQQQQYYQNPSMPQKVTWASIRSAFSTSGLGNEPPLLQGIIPV